jgi:hypothetical protein
MIQHFKATVELDQNIQAFCMCRNRFDIAFDRLEIVRII